MHVYLIILPRTNSPAKAYNLLNVPNCKPVTWLKSVLNILMDINFHLVLMDIYDIFYVFSNEMGLIYTTIFVYIYAS